MFNSPTTTCYGVGRLRSSKKRIDVRDVSKWLGPVGGMEARGKVEGFQVLHWNHQENGDTIKSNVEVKDRHPQGQDAGVGFGHAMWGYGGTTGWSPSWGSWICRDPGTEGAVRKWICKWPIEIMIWRHGHRGAKVSQGQDTNVHGLGMTCGWWWVHTHPKVCPKSRSPLLTLPISSFLVISTFI